MKGMAIPAVPRSDDRSVYQHHVWKGWGQVINNFTDGDEGTSQESRRVGAGPLLEPPSSRLQKANALARTAILG